MNSKDIWFIHIIENWLEKKIIWTTIQYNILDTHTLEIWKWIWQGKIFAFWTLYSIFIADLKFPRSTSALADYYTDDTAVTITAKQTKTIMKNLEKSAGQLFKFCERWKIQVNSAKTQATLFPCNNSRKRLSSRNVMIGNSSAHWFLGQRHVFGSPIRKKNWILASILKVSKSKLSNLFTVSI